MTRAIWIALPFALIACGKSSNTKDGVASSADDKGEPKVPPPPPTVKPGGRGDCKTEYAPRPKRDPNPMCKIDGGTFTMGDDEYGRVAVKLSPYYMDQFEVTNAQVAHYLNATSGADACMKDSDPCIRVGTGWKGDASNGVFIQKQADGRYAPDPGTERKPFDHATREGAMAYCAWAGKTLPTEPQWEFSARHDPGSNKDFIYPWGDQFDGARARCDHEKCPSADPSEHMVDVGSYDGSNGRADGRSPWGLHDMAGNASEIVADCFVPYTPCQRSCVDPKPVPSKLGEKCHSILRGGALQGERQLRTMNRDWGGPLAGFRCARPI